MKENEIKFKIRNHNGNLIELTGELKEDKVYRMGKPILCNCTGNTEDTATPFKFIDGVVKCSECGRQSEEVYTFKDYETHELTNLHLTYFGTDYITMQKLYKLSYTVPYEDWQLVSDLFMKLSPDMVDMGFFEPNYVGWVTSNPEAVEEILGVREELRVAYIEEEKKRKEQEKQEEMARVYENINNILEEFSVVETPQPKKGKGKFRLKGEYVDNPLNPQNDYGGGEWWIITDEFIWYVRQNSRDGDNWDFNNVYVQGSAGGIGKRVEYSEDLADRIRSLKR